MGLATACIGGGQGIAMVVESFHWSVSSFHHGDTKARLKEQLFRIVILLRGLSFRTE